MRFVKLEVDMNETCEIGSRYQSLYIKQIVCEIMDTQWDNY